MQSNFIIRWILQYYVLLDLFYTGVHTFNVRCAPIKELELYDIVTSVMYKLPELAQIFKEHK